MSSITRNRKGVMYVYAVLAASLAVLIFFWFFFADIVSRTIDAAPLTKNMWNNTQVQQAFMSAHMFVMGAWRYFLVIGVILLLIWAVIYQQRKNQGYGGDYW